MDKINALSFQIGDLVALKKSGSMMIGIPVSTRWIGPYPAGTIGLVVDTFLQQSNIQKFAFLLKAKLAGTSMQSFVSYRVARMTRLVQDPVQPNLLHGIIGM